jgi:hypothetical protein
MIWRITRGGFNASIVETAALILNPAGYHHNVMQTLTLNAA